MKKMLAGFAALAMLVACNNFEKTEQGVEYKIINSDDDARMVAAGDILEIHMKGVVSSTDSAIFDSYKAGKPFNIPAEEPSLKSVFSLLKKGDSAVFKILADTLFANFGEGLPTGVKSGDYITFYAHLLDIYNSQEMQKKIEEKNKEFYIQDSVALGSYLNGLTDVKSTATGLKYQIVKAGNGKQAKKGDKVTVKYRGSLLNGMVFDETKPGTPEFTFTVGAGMVIAGWDEGFQLMKEGDQYKLIIPWTLGYGPRGSGPIPPFSTLIFDVELVKIN
jgi:FKBP-type peptidyl-prolyl cis-trans isomerase